MKYSYLFIIILFCLIGKTTADVSDSFGRENTNIKSVSRIKEYNGEEEWLGCIPWTGKGSELPAGMITPVGITAKSLC